MNFSLITRLCFYMQQKLSGRQTSALFMALSRLVSASLKEPTRMRPSCSNRAPTHATAALKHTDFIGL